MTQTQKTTEFGHRPPSLSDRHTKVHEACWEKGGREEGDKCLGHNSGLTPGREDIKSEGCTEPLQYCIAAIVYGTEVKLLKRTEGTFQTVLGDTKRMYTLYSCTVCNSR